MSVLGLRVGPFEIIEPATVPGPGTWYRARRTSQASRQPSYALIRLLPPDADEPTRAALQQAFEHLRAVEDPRVPVAIALYEGLGALAVSAPDGVTLDEVIAERAARSITLTPATLLDVGVELAEALQHAHHRGRHHGHLGGHNVRLSTAGELTIFGFESGPDTPPARDWLAPERARGAPSTPLTDQWSLAATLAALVTGHPPWRDGQDPRDGDVGAIVDAVERQWPALARLFRRMLEPSPANRFPSIHPVRQELLALARKAGGVSERRELGKRMARRVPRALVPDEDIPTSLDPEEAPAPAAATPPQAEPSGGPDAPPPPEPTAPPAAARQGFHEPPSASDPPSLPQATRAVTTTPTPAPPLADEALAVVAPAVEDAEALRPARRPGEPSPAILPATPPPPPPAPTIEEIPPPVPPPSSPDEGRAADALDAPLSPHVPTASPPPSDEDDEEIDDSPTVRFDPLRAKELLDGLASRSPQPQPDVGPTVAAAAAPTAVPPTDGDATDPDEDAEDPQTLARALAAPPTPAPAPPQTCAPSASPAVEGVQVVRDLQVPIDTPRPAPERAAGPIVDPRHLATALVVAMLVLMVVAVFVSLR